MATADSDLITELREAGTPFVNLWSYLDETAALDNEDLAWDFCEAVGSRLKGRFVVAGCDVTGLVQDDLVYPVRYALNTATVVQRALEKYRPERVGVFEEHANAFFWDPPDPPPDIFNAAARWAAEQAGFTPHLLRIQSPHPERAKSPERVHALSPLPEQTAVLDVMDGLAFDEQDLLLRSVEQNAEPWVVLSHRSPPWHVPRVRRDVVRALPFQPAVMSPQGDVREADLCGLIDRMDVPGAEALTRNPYIAFLWKYFHASLIEAMRQFPIAQFLNDALQPSVVLSGCATTGCARAMVEAFQGAGRPVLCVNHSGLSWVEVRKRHRGDRGMLTAWGEWEARMLRKRRVKGGAVVAVGSLRPDTEYLRSASEVRVGSPAEEKPRIVLITARVAHLYYTACSPVRHEQLWNELLGFFLRHPDWSFVIKPHPRYDYPDLYASRRFRAVPNLSVSQGTMAESLRGARLAVSVTMVTTACLEPMAMNIPLISLEGAVFQRHRGHLQEGAMTVNSVEELERGIQRLLHDSAHYAAAVGRGRRFLDDVLCAVGDDAVANIRKVIETMRSESVEPSDSGRCATARWTLEMIQTLDHLMRGLLDVPACRSQLRSLRLAGRSLVWSTLDYLDVAETGIHLLEMPVFHDWAVAEKPYLPGLVWTIYCTLPRTIRPSLRRLRFILQGASQGRRDVAGRPVPAAAGDAWPG
ncbi:MAG: hypothetical protein JXQ75_24130 [Phycisphaerae bacterium]|nr:hypothetical protein [Phycisphaerae bacterium]